MGETIKSFLVSLGFGIDQTSFSQFNKAIASAAIRVTALYASIQVATAGIFKGISGIADSFEDLGYKTHMIIPAISKTILLRRAMYEAYNRAGIDLKKVVKQSVDFNFSLAKTKIALDAVYKSVGARFLPLLTKQMDIFRAKIFANMPKIQASLEKLIKFIFKAFEATVILGTRLWQVLGRVWDFFEKLDKTTGGWSTKILLAVAAWEFLNLAFIATPLGAVLAGLIAILALFDDFQTWKEGGKSLFDWSKYVPIIDQVAKSINLVIDTGTELFKVIDSVVKAFKQLANGEFKESLDSLKSVAQSILTIFLNIIKTLPFLSGGIIGAIPFEKIGNLIKNGGSIGDLFGGKSAAPALAGINQPAPLVNQNNGVNQRVSQETNINIQGSADANSTAKAVSGEQSKVNFDLTRNLKGAAR